MSLPPLDKDAIARNFSGAAGQYAAGAQAQAEIAATLARSLPTDLAPSRMVDLGCGSGLLSALLLERYPEASLVGLDLAEGMVLACRERFRDLARARFVLGDAEDPANLMPGVDLIATSCVVQWFSDPARTLCMWAEALVPGGVLACALLLRGSFAELENASRRALGTPFQGLRLGDPETLPTLAAGLGLTILHRREEDVVACHASARDALRSFSQIGAVFRGQPGRRPLSPGEVRRLLACYGDLTDERGRSPVTHRVQYLIAEKFR